MTRWWYVHRIAAALVLRFGLSYAVVIAIGHPTMIVGQTVERRRTRRQPLLEVRLLGRTLRIPGRRQRWGEPGPREYVVDVSLESVQATPVEPYEAATPTGDVEYEKEPAKVPLREVDDYQAADKPFIGCEGGCCGINWYCIENPRCFEPK